MATSQSKICVPVVGPSEQEAYAQVTGAEEQADLVEILCDRLNGWSLDSLRALCAAISLPVILRVGPTQKGLMAKQIEWARQLMTLRPAYLDLDEPIAATLFSEVPKGTRLICSHHDFQQTPKDLEALLLHMKRTPADFYKVATMAHSIQDALRLLKLASGQVIAIGMGSEGELTRLLGPLVGVPWGYAPLTSDRASAPGQLTVENLLQTYQYRRLNAATKIYGVIGDPVAYSLSPSVHNAVFRAFSLDAVYLPLRVPTGQARAFLQAAAPFNLQGLSVTMPLKQEIIEAIEAALPSTAAMGAVNTLKFEGERWVGSNTDAPGTLNAIEECLPVKGKRVLIYGAGGVARAVAYEALARGADVIIDNRTKERAAQLARALGCRSGAIEQQEYDILVHATPVGMLPYPDKLAIESSLLRPGALVVDLVAYPPKTRLIQEAKSRGCQTVNGRTIFVEQALLQLERWFGGRIDLGRARQIIWETIDVKDHDHS